ncbi:MAG: HAD-IIIA family hydrolase, partial [Pseudomonadota bacterium]
MGIIRQASHRAVFLDRDGVINQAIVRDGKPYAPTRLADVILLPYVANALDELKSAGFQLIVVTNQPDVARGKVEKADIEEIHTHLKNTLPLDAVYCCYHDDADGCACRKPKPGFLHEAAATYGL